MSNRIEFDKIFNFHILNHKEQKRHKFCSNCDHGGAWFTNYGNCQKIIEFGIESREVLNPQIPALLSYGISPNNAVCSLWKDPYKNL